MKEDKQLPMAQSIESICFHYGIDLLVLFGSRVREYVHKNSDFDVAVKMRGSTSDKLSLIVALEMYFNGSIDLVELTSVTDPLLLHEIFTHGKRLYEHQPGYFNLCRCWAWHLYLDTAWIRELEKTYIEKLAEWE